MKKAVIKELRLKLPQTLFLKIACYYKYFSRLEIKTWHYLSICQLVNFSLLFFIIFIVFQTGLDSLPSLKSIAQKATDQAGLKVPQSSDHIGNTSSNISHQGKIYLLRGKQSFTR